MIVAITLIGPGSGAALAVEVHGLVALLARDLGNQNHPLGSSEPKDWAACCADS